MKQLFIIRHAKSGWIAGEKDYERTLSNSGNRNAAKMVKRLVDRNLKPELIVSSPAVRALSTARHFATGWDISSTAIKTDERIYEAGVKDLLSVIDEFENSVNTIAIFGHNPGLTDLVNYLTDEFIDMPTCSIVVLEFPFDEWNLVSGQTGDLKVFDYPKSGMD